MLSGSGLGTPGSTCNEVTLTGAFPNSSAILVLGFSELALPFKGGVLGPAPDKLVFGITTSASGSFSLPFSLPLDVPAGVSTWNQLWIDDPGAVLGRSASNTLRFTSQASAGEGPLFRGTEYALPGFTTELAWADFNGDGALDVATQVGGFDPGVEVLLGSGAGTFVDSVFTTPVLPGQPMACDLNADGAPDLVSYNNGTVISLLGSGDGSFTMLPVQPVAPGSVAQRLRDLDADGVDDLVLLYAAPNKVVVRLGRGNGRFGPPIDSLVFVNAETFEVADMNGDAALDLVVVHDDLPGPSAGATTVMLGTGDGSFGAPTAFSTGSFSRALAVADINGDSVLDVLALNVGSLDVSVLLGQGDGSLGAASSLPVGADVLSLQLLDVDADGALDLAVTHQDVFALALFLGDGAGGFTPAPALPTVDVPRTVQTHDLDDDGVQDLVLLLQHGYEFAVLLGTDTGGFQRAPSFPAGPTPSSVLAADFDTDGRTDLVTLDQLAEQVLGLPNLGGGHFGAPVVLASFDQVNDLGVGDLTGDGRVDLVVSHPSLDEVHLVIGSAEGFGAPQLLNNGRGDRDFFITDVDLDGLADLVSLDPDDADDAAVVLLGTGGGAFAEPVSHAVGGNAIELLVGDVNADGAPDLVTSLATTPRSISVRLGLGDGAFDVAQFTEFAGLPTTSPILADFNADGASELAFARPLSLDVIVFPGGGDGSFGAPLVLQGGSGPLRLAAGDVDGDCVLDLVVTNSGESDFVLAPGDVWVLPGVGDGSFEQALRFTAGASTYLDFIASGPSESVLADFDGDGQLDLAVANDAEDAVVLLLNQRFDS
ncbi:MAG: hypothetical protein DHS20C15_22660 [Planctomycetota bacterium]|nr:MAG: hypothetical protein DHS20C15_22660 [Planctomycetota bacterium]